MRHFHRFIAAGMLWLTVLALPAIAWAETRVYVFTADNAPSELLETANAVAPSEATITLTMAGDCTLGGETSVQRSSHSFRSIVEKNGMGYPFSELAPLFQTDDFTIVNLEGVLSDSAKVKEKKMYNFIGATAYTDVLIEGGIECVNLANNHSYDFKQEGFIDTVNALDGAGIGRFDESTLCVLEKDGIRIGLTATLFRLNAQKTEILSAQMKLLRELGCSAIIHTMHAGIEYRTGASARQKSIAQTAMELGAALVVGHHPHVVQGVDVLDNGLAVYSLGNCCFGGNTDPKDYDGALLRATFHFTEGALDTLDWSLFPISVSSIKGRNNFQPVLLGGSDAERVMDKIQKSTSIVLKPFEQDIGARQEPILFQQPME